jgi:hypothetical protein
VKRSPRPRRTAELPKSLNQQLNLYALAATAAGVGWLASVQPAEARIIYTKAHLVIPPGMAYGIDLTHDGFDDFQINNVYRTSHSHDATVVDLFAAGNFKGDVVAGRIKSGSNTSYAYALFRGAKIGPSRKFSGGNMLGTYNYSVFGKWDNVRDRYLGLRLQIKGKVYFGWARLSVSFVSPRISALLTGYAYETIPNKPIIAGRTKGPDVTTVSPASLGHLAAGASAIRALRTGSR